jgi:hypothetical protein
LEKIRPTRTFNRQFLQPFVIHRNPLHDIFPKAICPLLLELFQILEQLLPDTGWKACATFFLLPVARVVEANPGKSM